MKVILGMLAFGAMLLVCGGLGSVAGCTPTTGRTEDVPVSIRDNPASWKPAYGGGGVGYRVPTSSSSGGYSGGK
jgi:hypothetical protein